MFELEEDRTYRTSQTPAIELLALNGRFYYKGAYHKVLIKNKTNVQAKNIFTGKPVHIPNKTFVSL
jgi:hypothetical protein